ncbi:DHH family phosphoesterase [Celerinatantimonas sp. YJH-8]|uniref:DHH family phosphoesterase n=1 Tax=Celerinatantimonas sp. YJH-8 TaxID=3228714 RepID=UPI0038CC0499
MALLQLRHADPRESILVTGVKRDIKLLEQVSVQPGDMLTVLDISLKSNHDALERVLAEGAQVTYFDHHAAGDIPDHSGLITRIDPAPEVCTSLIVDRYLNGRYREWAIAAAFGDNLVSTATQLAEDSGFGEHQIEQLKTLGVLVNYNGYGHHLEDLHVHPAKLYRQLSRYHSPFDLIRESESVFTHLEQAYQQDMQCVKQLRPYAENDVARMYILPHQAWSRRVSGVYSNQLANEEPTRANAVVTDNGDETYTISVRAPLANRQGANAICSQFPSGGGREAAAGVNQLPFDQLEYFWSVFSAYYQ